MQVPAFDTAELNDSHTLWLQATDENDTPMAATSPAVEIYDDTDFGAMSLGLSPVSATPTGLHHATVTVSGANGFERGKSYLVRWTATVDSVSRVSVGRLHIT